MGSMAALQSSMGFLSLGSYSSSGIFGSSLRQSQSRQGQAAGSGPLVVRMAVKPWEKADLKPNGLPVRHKVHVNLGDTVKVIAGRDKGKIAEVTEVFSHNAKPADELWEVIRAEAREQSKAEPYLASFLYATIMAHSSLERALAFHVANKLADATLLSTQLFSLFADIFASDLTIKDAIRADILAFKERDPACQGYVHGMLYFKGFLACQIHRAAHRLWGQGRTALALALQNRVSEVFQVDIHPGATLGKGLLFDHATGVVIGETARVGDNVSILHHVTLGGTGACVGNRHPKIRDGVLIGAGATLLGPIIVGECAQIGASSLVLSDIPPYCTAVGVPARIIEPKQSARPLDVPGQSMDHCTAIIQDYEI